MGRKRKEMQQTYIEAAAARLVQVVEHHNALREVEVYVLPLL